MQTNNINMILFFMILILTPLGRAKGSK